MGYWRAGFDVVGVDVEPQPRYPFQFHQGDAMTFPIDGFDVIHASPPCQDWSALRTLQVAHGTGWLLTATLERLAGAGVPWVVENVPGAEMGAMFVTLCGSSFGLGVRRHRHFASSVMLLAPACQHRLQGQPLGVYGVGGSCDRGHGRKGTIEESRQAMGIDWMSRAELSQAIPPAYTEHIGGQLLAHLRLAHA